MFPIKIGIPVYCERDWLPRVLASLSRQDDLEFEVWICVNQPAEYETDPAYGHVHEENRETLAWLEKVRSDFEFPIQILEALRTPEAPPGKVAGVGWARRYIFDRIVEQHPDAVCISLDADTTLETNYVRQVRLAFENHPNAVALAAPYYHPLPEAPDHALRLLRYEIYLRYYQLSLWRIGSPYAFLPLGSAMAFRAESYRRMGGMPLRKAGEDFYFLQQMRKTGPVIRWLDSLAYPSARVSERNPFGTGPTMGEPDMEIQARRYPFYAQSSFDRLAAAFRCFPRFYGEHFKLPIHELIMEKWGGYEGFEKMRQNVRDERHFVKACHERIDGLATFQCLRFYQPAPDSTVSGTDEVDVLMNKLGKPELALHFEEGRLETLNKARDQLCQYESDFQKAFMQNWDPRARW